MLAPFKNKYAYWWWLRSVVAAIDTDEENQKAMVADVQERFGIRVLFDRQRQILPEFEVVDEKKWLFVCLTL